MTRRAAAAALAMLVLAALRDLVSGGRFLYFGDVHVVWIGQAHVLLRSLADGSWPVWDPWLGFGQPFLANPNTQVFYPFTLLLFLMAPWVWYSVYVVAHLLFAAAGGHHLARRLGLERSGAVVAAAVWTASGPLASFAGRWHHFAGAAWMPWVLVAADRALERGRRRDLLAWAAAVALQVFAGSPDVCLMTGWLTVALLAGHWARRPAEWRALLTRCAGAGSLSLGLAAAQMWPTIEATLGSTRASLPVESRAIWAVTPLTSLQILLPLSFQDLPRYAPLAAGAFEAWDPFMRSVYLGLAPALLVAAAWRARHRRLALAAAAIGLLAVLASLGQHLPVYAVFSRLAPGASLIRYPAKFMVVAALAWGLLAGLGFEALLLREDRRRRLVLGTLAGVAAIGVVATLLLTVGARFWARAYFVPNSDALTVADILWPNAVRVAVAAACALAALVAAAWRTTSPSRGVILALAAVLDPLAALSGVNPTTSAAFFHIRPEIVDVLAKTPVARVYVWDYAMRVQGRGHDKGTLLSSFVDIPLSAGPLAPALALETYLYPPIGERWRISGSYDRDLMGFQGRAVEEAMLLVRAVDDTPAFRRLMEIGSVDYVIALHTDGMEELQPVATLAGVMRRPVQVLKVPTPLPRAYLVGGWRGRTGADALRTLVDPAFAPTREVVLPLPGDQAAPEGPVGEVLSLQRRTDRVTVEVEARGPAHLVLTDTYDRGWRAWVDGAQAEVLPANVLFQAVAVPAGRHRVELAYRPSSVVLGAAVSLLSVLLAGGLWASARGPS